MLAQLPLPIVGSVGLLGGHRQPARHLDRLDIAATYPAKHAARPATSARLVGGQGDLGLLAVGAGPDQFPAAIPGCLVELAAEPVPLGPQLPCRQPLEIGAAGGVDGQPLATSPRQSLGELEVGVGLVPVGKVQFAGALGFGADHGVQVGVLAGPRQLHIQPVHVLAAGEPDQGPPRVSP